jgi:hypothetical protein
MRLFLAAVLGSPAALGGPAVRVGLSPPAMPDGQAQIVPALAAQIRDGAVGLPGVAAFALSADSCAPDEAACLAEAARQAKLDAMVSAAVTAKTAGYAFHLREVSAAGQLLGERRGEVRGGPLDLSGALEHGVCELLGAARCEGGLRILGAPVAVSVDGVERGTPPVIVQLPVGRHVVRADGAERRVRVSYGRTVQITARDGTLLDDSAPAAPPVAAPVEAVSASRPPQQRAQASRALLGSGLGLLAAAVGVGLYAHASPSPAASYAAYALAATGAGAVVGAGLLLALTPSGAAVQGSF